MATPTDAGLTKAERIAAYREILSTLWAAQKDKAGQGSAAIGDVSISWSNYDTLQRQIDTYTYRLRMLESGRTMVN